MKNSIYFSTNSDFDSYLVNQTDAFAAEAVKRLGAFAAFALPTSTGPAGLSLCPAANSQADGFVASVLFMGPVFGEFYISMPTSTAEKIFQSFLDGLQGEERAEMIAETLSELLNQCAGNRIEALNQTFKKLTIASPKVARGKVMYRSIRASEAVLNIEDGKVCFGLYIDQMQTDMAEAHQEMIESLKQANSELKVVNQKMKDQQAQLVQSEKMASLGLMAAGVAHEINNPLSFVIANTETLSSYVDVTTKLIEGYSNFLNAFADKKNSVAATEFEKLCALEDKEEIEYVVKDSQKLIAESRDGLDRIKKIVNGLKRFSRLEGSESQSAQLNDEIVNTLELLRNELKYACAIETNFKPLRPIFCNPSELSQVFMNLIVNARQALPESGGKISIETEETATDIEIRIRDNGHGMAQTTMDKIFEPFFTTKPAGKGTGLGLAISYGIIQKHGGKLEVESEVGKGTCFTIKLPLTLANMGSNREAQSAA